MLKPGRLINRRGRQYCLTAALTIGLLGTAQAFTIPTGNDDFSLSLTNTLTYNLGVRAQPQDPSILNSPGYYSSDAKFDQWDVMTNRIGITSKLAAVYEPNFSEHYGLIISADAWYDGAYSDTDVPVDPAVGKSAYNGNSYSNHTKRYYRGVSAELLDAFFFAHRNIGGVPTSLKVGRLTQQWGPGLILGAFATSVAQQPTNVRKALVNPGAKVEELFLPVGQVSVSMALTSRLSVSAQYFLEFGQNRNSAGGTYYGGPDYLFKGPDRAPALKQQVNAGLAPTPLPPTNGVVNRGYKKPNGSPEFGLKAIWRHAPVVGDIGLYFRRFNNKQPWFALTTVPGGTSTYRSVFPTQATLYGFSFNRNVGNWSVGVEASYVHNAALINNGSLTANGKGPRGDVELLDINGTLTTGGTAFYDSSTLLLDVGYQHLNGVNHHPEFYNGRDYGCEGGRNAGCGTRNALQMAVNFTPEWIQVFPLWNFYMPLTLTYTPYGNGATLAAQANGVNQGAVNYSAGVKAQYRANYTATLQYIGSYAHYQQTTIPGRGRVASGGSGGWMLNDRGRILLTLKADF